ncbi:MAG: hypothetical protein LBG98_03880 [Puniceicoccales bacterium]|nr:hypothetical protein [Puniceicoccales bacterium]
MENCIAASGDPVGDTLSALICAWSSVSPLYKEILNDLARLGIDACPDYSFIINCYPMAGFYERFNLIPFWGQHRPVGIQQNLRFLPENIQTDECVIKCYGTGVTIVDDYDGSSDSPTLRCRSLPWGIKKPLDFRRPIIAIVLENSELSEVRGYLWCFAVMCIYRADETLKVALNLYFASSNAAVNIDLAVGAFLDGNRVIPFAAGVGRFSDILVARMQAHMQAYASDDDDD